MCFVKGIVYVNNPSKEGKEVTIDCEELLMQFKHRVTQFSRTIAFSETV